MAGSVGHVGERFSHSMSGRGAVRRLTVYFERLPRTCRGPLSVHEALLHEEGLVFELNVQIKVVNYLTNSPTWKSLTFVRNDGAMLPFFSRW